jgi:3,4-dihydroxy 2-butanone 4-phosphate synthase/GTP cyclohydrolase II
VSLGDLHQPLCRPGDIGDGRDIPMSLHRVDVIAGGDSIRKTFAAFKKNGRGVFIFLRDGTAGVPVNPAWMEKPDAETKRIMEWREIGLGAQILRDLGSPRSACAPLGR